MVVAVFNREAPSVCWFDPGLTHVHRAVSMVGAPAPLSRLGGGPRGSGGAAAGTGGASDAALRAAGGCSLEDGGPSD